MNVLRTLAGTAPVAAVMSFSTTVFATTVQGAFPAYRTATDSARIVTADSDLAARANLGGTVIHPNVVPLPAAEIKVQPSPAQIRVKSALHCRSTSRLVATM